MTKQNLPPIDYLRKRLDYDARTGQLVWRSATPCDWLTPKACAIINTKYAGKVAATAINGWGYRITAIQGTGFLAHRVIWAIYYGDWPDAEIDHIDGDKLNNRIENLRSVDGVTNRRNMPIQKNNTSGHAGVTRRGQKWVARIGSGRRGSRVHLGVFETKDEAVAARGKALKQYGYTERHGT